MDVVVGGAGRVMHTEQERGSACERAETCVSVRAKSRENHKNRNLLYIAHLTLAHSTCRQTSPSAIRHTSVSLASARTARVLFTPAEDSHASLSTGRIAGADSLQLTSTVAVKESVLHFLRRVIPSCGNEHGALCTQ